MQRPPPPPNPNPNFFLNPNNPFTQNPHFLPPNPNFTFQIPNFPPNIFPINFPINPSFPTNPNLNPNLSPNISANPNLNPNLSPNISANPNLNPNFQFQSPNVDSNIPKNPTFNPNSQQRNPNLKNSVPRNPHLNPNIITKPNLNPNFLQQNPNWNPNFHPQNTNLNPNFQPQNPNLQPQNPNLSPKVNPRTIDEIDRAVVKARKDLVAKGENVATLKVSEMVLMEMKANSWEGLGFPMQQIPSFYRLIKTEGKINAFIHCFVAVRRITSLHDLDVAICKNEGVERYEALELGPLVRHPLVMHYFSLSSYTEDIFNITSEEIISCLCEFIDIHKGSEIGIDEFLDFTANRRSVSEREKLNVRIESFGMHISFIRQAKRLECDTLKKCLKEDVIKKEPHVSLQKMQLDEHFDSISKSIDSFSSLNKDLGGIGKHLKISSSPEEIASEEPEDEVNINEENSVSPNHLSTKYPVSSNQTSCCPYPSAEEERSRLELRTLDVCIDPSPINDNLESKKNKRESKRKRESENKSQNDTTRCKRHKTAKEEPVIATKRRKKLAKLVKAECSPETEPAKKDAVRKTKDVSVDDIVQKVSTYFEHHKILSTAELTLKPKLSFLRKLCKCEVWLTKLFSVNKFKSLGHGKFFKFLEKHVSHIHDAFLKCFTGETFKKPSLEVCMLDQQLVVFLSQAANNFKKPKNMSKEMISLLLLRQFPVVNFVLAEGGLIKDFVSGLKKRRSISTSVLFSATLLSKNKEDIQTHVAYGAKTFGSVTTKDAIGVLLKAPMLSDLSLWAHWDIIFAPSLGPLVKWLMNEVNAKQLLCLVTNDGKVIRINHTATVESFSKACLQGSSFQIAVELLSLLSLYGGDVHVPLSLLKSHACQAFEVIMKNSGEVKSNKNKRKKAKVASRFFIDCLGHLPVEFHTFAADILLSGLQFVLKDAPSLILRKCEQNDQRHLLHNVGLSLGISEWIDDYHLLTSSMLNDSTASSGKSCESVVHTSNHIKDELCKLSNKKECKRVSKSLKREASKVQCKAGKQNKRLMLVESIRREQFGLDAGFLKMEASILKKQHARLGRALHCLSQELYSHNSHFLLELVQNADHNIYPENVDPTLTFILQESGIIVLNNERGFSSKNIKALCDVGSSTKKKGPGGYIRNKGIGFKSVFRITDAPEIHSNGFHVKFDITEGDIGFVLPTVVPACDMDCYKKMVVCDTDKAVSSDWNTCIVLPFKAELSDDSSSDSIRMMFHDLHPSLLLFLHRLRCIRFKNILDNTMVIMRKEIVGNGIVNVSAGKEKMTWFVISQGLQADVIDPDVHKTEISIAFTLKKSGNGEYVPHLEQQPVFAFLPLRRYGLKFIIQGDFVLPSSREELDGDSPWNQWLLGKFPDLFISAEKSFCTFPCFEGAPGKAVSVFMSFVPLDGEVQGFFSCLPKLIVSKLRTSKCLLMEGDKEDWVLPCKVLRNWNEEALKILPAKYLRRHLGLGLLDRNIALSDPLAKDLGVQEYGPSILVQVVTSLCKSKKGIKSAGVVWIASWLSALYSMLFNSSGQVSLCSGTTSDVITDLRKIPFIPLSDGAYSSVDDGTIWLHSDSVIPRSGNEHHADAFHVLYAKLRIVSPTLFSAAATVDSTGTGMPVIDDISKMLLRIGVRQLSAHEIVKGHILPAISDNRNTLDDKEMMLEYLSFVMCHLQSSCPNCHVERKNIISELRERAFISTNHGYRRPAEVAIHFGQEFANTIDVNKLIIGTNLEWHEVDVDYLQHPITGSRHSGMRRWREFFQEIGITDFVQVVSVEKNITDSSNEDLKSMFRDGEPIPHGAVANDWESQELIHLLSHLSLTKDPIKSQYLLEALDTFWEDSYSDKVAGCCTYNSSGDSRTFRSSFITCLCSIRWIASSRDAKLHYAKDLFYDCEAVYSVLGSNAPYSVPKLKSEKLLSDIGFKTQVSLTDALSVLRSWRRLKTPFVASLTHMSKFYTFVWNGMATSKQKIIDALLKGPFIFCPYSCDWRHDDLLLGVLLSPSEVHWHDSSGSLKQIKEIICHRVSNQIDCPLCKTLCNIYPSLHPFFVNECGVSEIPHHRSYLQTLLMLSTNALPSQTGKTVFQVFLQWSDGFKSGLLNSDDVIFLKECLQRLDFTVLPTVKDKWVSLHTSFGLVCWSDDGELKKEFECLDNIEILYFGELSIDEQQRLHSEKLSIIMQTLGIPSLSQVVTREAIHYGLADCSLKTSLLNWIFPYAQRYIYYVHGDIYVELKQSDFKFLSQLQIIGVDKLFSRNIVKGSNIASKKRHECKCLLQGNILYAAQTSDSYSMFMEFSTLLFGVPDLELANFLHMISIMHEAGSSEDQIEFFIINSQKIRKLPRSEPIWSFPSSSSVVDGESLQTNYESTTLIDQTPKDPKRKSGTSWPPADWKTAPGFSSPHNMCMTFPSAKGLNDSRSATETDQRVSTEECDPAPDTAMAVLPDSQTLKDQHNVVGSVDMNGESEFLKLGSFFPNDVSQIIQNGQALFTGRVGEHVAFNYFSENAGKNVVTWVNQEIESGLPYDLVIEDEQKSREYIEVKSTKSPNKDWFHLSLREWQFALEKGECFTIAHVILSGNDLARMTMFKNPVKLCQLGKLQLAVLIPKQLEEFSAS